MPNAQAEAIKGEGNAFFKAGKYAEAIEKYNAATAIDASVPAYWSNMAACYEKLGNYEKMGEAARSCIKADKNFVKGYFRLATAQKGMNDLEGCIKTLESGLAIQASNPDLKKMKKEIAELQRGEQVAAYCRKADEQMQGGDIAGAHKTLELASRLDAGNPDIERMMSKVKPRWEKMEAQRKAGLSGAEAHKEKGDEKYKNADFEGAVEEYTKCLDDLKKEGKELSELALKAHSNRAACYKQISNFDGTIEGEFCDVTCAICHYCSLRLLSALVSVCSDRISTTSYLVFPSPTQQTARPFWRSIPTTSRLSFVVLRPSRDWSATALLCRMSSRSWACPTTRSASRTLSFAT
jgi:tetratricopeptide (TPR) repeat protein